MSYSSNNESNSLSLAMFASVGFHAILFVAMAFFPASSETVKKPLRIVNLLPSRPGQSPFSTPGSQAKTSTLQDILQNPLPDLSAGVPPLGNTNEPLPDPASVESNTSSYVSNGSNNYNSGVDTSGLGITDPPNPSFSPSPSRTPAQSGTQAAEQEPSGKSSVPSSRIQPAPNTPGSQLPPSPEIPDVASALPPPQVPGAPSPFPGPSPGSATLGNRLGVGALPNSVDIPESKQRVIPIISTTVPYSYPVAACRDSLEGTATLSYYRSADGSYISGSGTFENRSGFAILDTEALNAVINAPAVGTGMYQRYSSRFDFIYSDSVCAASGAPVPASPATPSKPEQPGSAPQPQPEKESKPKQPSSPNSTSTTEPSRNSTKPEAPSSPKTADPNTKPEAPPRTNQPSKPSGISQPDVANPGDRRPAPASPAPSEPSPSIPEAVQPPAPAPSAPTPAAPVQPAPSTPKGAASDLLPTKPVAPAPPLPTNPPEPSPGTPATPPAEGTSTAQ